MMLSQPFREATINPAARTTRTSPAMTQGFRPGVAHIPHGERTGPQRWPHVPRSGWTMIRAMDQGKRGPPGTTALGPPFWTVFPSLFYLKRYGPFWGPLKNGGVPPKNGVKNPPKKTGGLPGKKRFFFYGGVPPGKRGPPVLPRGGKKNGGGYPRFTGGKKKPGGGYPRVFTPRKKNRGGGG